MPYDELALFCQKLLKKYDLLKVENELLKKENDSHSCHATIPSSFIVKNEFHISKNRIDCLISNLSDYAFDHNRLESMFRKKHIPHVHAHHSWYTYARHAHTHTTHMHARMCTCIHCSRKRHLANFYFDRLYSSNFVNKKVWVPIATNPPRL